MRRVTTILSKLMASPDDALALDLSTVKLQRKVGTSSALDSLFMLWIQAATTLFQQETGRQVLISAFEYTLDALPLCQRYLELPKPPLVTVQSVEYLDSAAAWQTWDAANYTVRTPTGDYCAPGRILLNDGCSWPSHLCREGAVRITFDAGYAETSSTVPPMIQAALLYLVGHFHKYSEEVVGGSDAANLQKVPLGASALMQEFKYSARLTQAPWEVSWLD